jgi:hypothetical protein
MMKPARISAAELPPEQIEPSIPTLVSKPPRGLNRRHEIKCDVAEPNYAKHISVAPVGWRFAPAAGAPEARQPSGRQPRGI